MAIEPTDDEPATDSMQGTLDRVERNTNLLASMMKEQLDRIERDQEVILSAVERVEHRVASELLSVEGACAIRGDVMQQLYRLENKLDKLEARLGGAPKPGFGFATLDTLDEKISALFVAVERVGGPRVPAWTQGICEAHYGPNARPGLTVCELPYGHAGTHSNKVLGGWHGTGRQAR